MMRQRRNRTNFLLSAFLALFLLSTSLFAHDPIHLKGRVIDRRTERGLAGANIQLLRTGKGVASDENGYFSFNLSSATSDTLLITFIGYDSAKIPLNMQKDDTIFILVRLTPIAIPMPEINITTDRFASYREIMDVEPNARRLSRAELSMVPGLVVQDVFQSIRSLPGITTASQSSTQLSVRGGDFDQNLVLLDGAVLYYPYHSLNVASDFLIDTIDRLDVLMGGYSSRFGGRLSSVIYVRTKQPTKKLTTHLNISWIDYSGTIEARPNQKMGIILSGRKNFNRALNGFFNQNYAFDFYDLFAKITLRPFRRHFLEMLYFQNMDGQNLDEKSSYVYPYEGEKIPYDYLSRRAIHYTNDLYVANYAMPLTERSSAHLHFSSSALETFFDASYQIGLNAEQYPQVYEILQNAVLERNRKEASKIDNVLRDCTAKIELTWQPSDRLTLNAGGEWSRIEFHYAWSQYNNSWAPYIYLFFDHAPKYNYRFFKKVRNMAFYVENTWKATDWLHIKSGLRWSRWQGTFPVAEPRLAVHIRLPRDYHIKCAAGRFSQGVATALERGLVGFLPLYFPVDRQNRPAMADHLILSLERKNWHGINYSISGYIKNFYHLLKSDVKDSLFSSASGKALGIEISADACIGNVATTVSYVYSKSYRTYRGLQYDAKADKRQQLQASATINLTPKLTITASWQFHTGRPYSPGRYQFLTRSQTFLPSPNRRETLKYSWTMWYDDRPVFSIRYPYYHSLDVRATYRFRLKRFELAPYLSIYNLYNRQNVLYYTSIGYDVFTRDDGTEDIRVGRSEVYVPFIATAGVQVQF